MNLWIDSLGGMATYEAFRSASYIITTVIYDTLSGRVKRARPRYVWMQKGPSGLQARIERWEGNDFIVQGFNGRDEWATMNGTFLPDTAKDWRETRYVTGDVSYWPGLPYKLRDDGVFLRYPVVVQRDWITASGKRTKALIVSDFVVNPAIDQSVFDRPET